MRKIIATLAFLLTIGAVVPAFAATAAGAESSTFRAEAGAGGR